MEVYELVLKVFLLKSIESSNALEKISEIIDKTLAKDEKFLDFHDANKFKYYSYTSFFPIEKDKIYREGRIYSIKIRALRKDLVEYLKKNLVNEYTEHVKSLTLEYKIINKKHIEKIYSITPVIMKTNKGYWKGNLSLTEFERRTKENLIKKYNDYFNTKIDEDFELFRMIKFENNKPISCLYKNIKILGDKLTINIAENSTAQELTYFALGAGILEMNSRGYGFVNYKWI
ncbi:MAG: CRISPR-associated endoribonuclease Cas6 [Clostridiaceae bacterium]